MSGYDDYGYGGGGGGGGGGFVANGGGFSSHSPSHGVDSPSSPSKVCSSRLFSNLIVELTTNWLASL
jgi:hypothetical protein